MTTTVLDRSTLTLGGVNVATGYVELDQAITSIGMTETITGASTLDIACNDAHRKLLQSPQLKIASPVVLDDAGFTLVAVSKSGSSVNLQFEDIAVAALRTHTTPRKVGPGQMSRVDFCRMLIREEPWITVNVPTPGPKSLVELARGSTGEAATDGSKPEDTWDAIGRIMGEIGWRVFARRGVVTICPDSWLVAQAPYPLKENTGGVDEIDFNFDIGKPAATASFTCRVGFADLPAGSAVTLSEMGPADGAWIVESIDRDPSTVDAKVSLLRPQPTLPEPTGDTGNAGVAGYTASNVKGASTGTPTTGKLETFVQAALAQQGKAYVWAKVGPDSFDCSGLVLYAAAKIGVSLPHNSGAQYAALAGQGKAISVAQALATRGALLFSGSGGGQHVAISLGNGSTIEAMGKAYGVVVGNAKGRFTLAATL